VYGLTLLYAVYVPAVEVFENFIQFINTTELSLVLKLASLEISLVYELIQKA
jgi:hypothetical protein